MQTRLELYKLVTPLAGLGIWERNLLTGEVYWNSIVRELLGVGPDHPPELEAALQFYKDPDTIRALIDEVISTGQPRETEVELITAAGKVKWVRLRINSISANGVTELLYGTMEDLSKEIALRQQLIEGQQRFCQAFDHAPIGMALVSLEGKWNRVNNSLCNLLGYAEEELMGRTFQEFTYPDDLESDLEQMQQLIQGKIFSYSMEKRYRHKDGRIIWVQLNVSLVRDDNNIPLYFVSQIKDITEHKKNIDVIKAQNEKLMNFAHIVSHNLRSHAGNINMLAGFIRAEFDEEERTTLTQMLVANSEELLNTLAELNKIVTITRKGMAHQEPVNLLQEVSRAVSILSASIKELRARVDIEIDEDIIIDFNPAYLESIFVNLISNSLKYRHPERTPIILIKATRDIERTCITITDNGSGLDMSLHGHKLFGMYKVFHGNRDARGMGLFLVKNQVESMGGTIHAASMPGEGMCMTIKLNKA